MFVDFIQNGVGHGDVGSGLQGVRYDPGLLRPYFNERGVPCVTVNTGRQVKDNKTGRMVPVFKSYPQSVLMSRGIMSPVFNATQMRKDEWIQMDQAVQRAIRLPLRAWSDLAAANSYSGFDGMSKMTLEYESMSDVGEALQDMDGLADGRTDAPLFNIRSMPLPITHSDFFFSERRLAVSRNSSMPLDTTMAEMAGRRCAELIEKQTIGIETGIEYGTRSTGPFPHEGVSKVYGYINSPNRITKTDLTTPTGTNPEAIVQDILEMIEQLNTLGYFGPFVLYHTTPYSIYLNSDYFRAGSTAMSRTVRQRIMELDGISDIRRLDLWTTGYQLLLVSMEARVARAVIGMPVTTVQWPSSGGMRQNFKVMGIMVPQIKATFDGHTGIVHGTTS